MDWTQHPLCNILLALREPKVDEEDEGATNVAHASADPLALVFPAGEVGS